MTAPPKPAEQLSFHPLADLFPLMEGAEFDELVADIKKNGLNDDIILYEDKILDGRNRYRACEAAGVTPGFRIAVQSPDQSNNLARPLITDPTAYVISANLHRRHLTAEQKRDLIAKLLKADSAKSDRQIGGMAKVDHHKVGKVRKEEEDVGKIPHVEVRTDTRGRKQPAKKAPKIAIDPKRDIVREAFDLVLRMSEEQRAEFFDLYLQRYGDQKYRGKFTEAWREAKAPDGDGLDIPEWLERTAP